MEIKLGGQSRLLKFSHIALRSIEKHYGMAFQKIFQSVDIESIENLTVFIWACMKRYDQALTIEDVDLMIDEALDIGEISYEELGKVIQEVIKDSVITKQMKPSKNSKRA